MCPIPESLCRSCNVHDFLIINVSSEYRNGILKKIECKGNIDTNLVAEDLTNNTMDLHDMMICPLEGVCMPIMPVSTTWRMSTRNITET